MLHINTLLGKPRSWHSCESHLTHVTDQAQPPWQWAGTPQW